MDIFDNRNPPVDLKKRTPSVAMIWSFAGAGLGQFYNGDFPKGGAFIITQIICGIVFWPLCIPVALWSIYDAHGRAIEISQNVEFEEHKIQQQKNIDEVIYSTRTKVIDFIARVDKLNTLNKSKLLSEDEYRSKISELISELSHKRAFENQEDFLMGLIPLVSSGALNSDEVNKIKSLTK